jgi:hypothetical protein
LSLTSSGPTAGGRPFYDLLRGRDRGDRVEPAHMHQRGAVDSGQVGPEVEPTHELHARAADGRFADPAGQLLLARTRGPKAANTFAHSVSVTSSPP